MRNTKTVFEIVLGNSMNFMTPEVLEYITMANYHIEISHGWGIKAPDGSQNELFGITIIEEGYDENLILRHDLSTVVFDEKEIEEYLDLVAKDEEFAIEYQKIRFENKQQ